MKQGAKIALMIGVPVAMLCGGAGWLALKWIDLPTASASLENQVSQAKALGLPWEAKDLAPKPLPADRDNAVKDILELSQQYALIPKANQLVTQIGNELKDGNIQIVKLKLAKFAHCLEIIERACEKKECYIERDLDLGMQLQFPEFAVNKSAAKLLAARAQVRVSDGNASGAAKDISRMGKIARFQNSEKCLIGLIVAIAIDSLRTKAIETLISNAPNSTSLQKLLIEELDKHPTVA